MIYLDMVLKRRIARHLKLLQASDSNISILTVEGIAFATEPSWVTLSKI